MLRFCGFGLELVVDEVLVRLADDPVVCAATDMCGGRWLIVETNHKDKSLSWLCAPASSKAVELVASGRATAMDAIRHSTTGWVELVQVVDGHAVPDRRLRCSEIPTEAGGALLPV
jgi:hypothetical protein